MWSVFRNSTNVHFLANQLHCDTTRVVFTWPCKLTCIIFGLSFLCSLIGRKRDFRIILMKNMAKAIMYRLYLSLLVFPTLSDWVKVITFRMLTDAICSSKIHEQLCFHFKFWRAVEKRSVHFILSSQEGRKSLFSINFCHCLTVGKSIHQDFGTNFTHLQVGNHLNFEHKIKTNWSITTRRENHAVYLHSNIIARWIRNRSTGTNHDFPGLNWLDAHSSSRYNSRLSFAKFG